MFTAPQTFMLCCVRWPDMAVIENLRWFGFSDFHLLLWAASANNHGLPMAVIGIIFFVKNILAVEIDIKKLQGPGSKSGNKRVSGRNVTVETSESIGGHSVTVFAVFRDGMSYKLTKKHGLAIYILLN